MEMFSGGTLAACSLHLCGVWVCGVSNYTEYTDGVIQTDDDVPMFRHKFNYISLSRLILVFRKHDSLSLHKDTDEMR